MYAEITAYVDDSVDYRYAELGDRSDRLAGALRQLGVEHGDRLSVLCPDTSVALEVQFGVPGVGAVLNSLKTRLSAAELVYIIGPAGSSVVVVDHELVKLGRKAVSPLPVRLIVAGGPDDEYEELVHPPTIPTTS